MILYHYDLDLIANQSTHFVYILILDNHLHDFSLCFISFFYGFLVFSLDFDFVTNNL